MKRTVNLMSFLLIIALLPLFSLSIFAAFDPFSPQTKVTVWLEPKTNKNEVESLLRQAGFLTETGPITGRALITNKKALTDNELTAVNDFLAHGGRVIGLGTNNLPQVTFLGYQSTKPHLAYLEINQASIPWEMPKLIKLPTTTVSIFTAEGTSLAGYYNQDGYKPSHIPLFNNAICQFDWGLYSGLDWFSPIFLDDATLRQLILFWLRSAIWR